MALLLSLIPMIGWGLNAIFIAKISRIVGEALSSLLILFTSTLFILSIFPIASGESLSFRVLDFAYLGLLGAIAYYLYNKALAVGRVSVVVPITTTWGAVSSMLGILFLNEQLTMLKIFSIVTITSGIFLVAKKKKDSKTKNKNEISLAILISVLYGFLFFLVGRSSKGLGWYPTTVGLQVFNVLFLFIFLLGSLKRIKTKLSLIPWKLLMGAGFVDAVALTGYNYAVNKYDISFVAVIASAAPLVSVLLASIFLREKTNLVQKIGILIIVCGIIMLQIAS